MNLDLGPFSNESFEPKKWINSACQTLSSTGISGQAPRRSGDEASNGVRGDRRLTLGAANALLYVPRATRDVIRLRDDAVSLRSAVSEILQKLKKLNVRKCNECGQPLPESFEPPADEPWTTGIFGCAEDP